MFTYGLMDGLTHVDYPDGNYVALPASGKNPSEESLTELLPWSDSLPDYCKAAYSEIL